MKRFLIIFGLIILLICILPYSVFAQEQSLVKHEIVVIIDGLKIELDQPPIIKNDASLVPFRPIAEALNITVDWKGETKTINAWDEKTKVKLQINNEIALSNNEPMALDAAPMILNSNTLIPLRFFAEAFNCGVVWDGATKMIQISTPPQKTQVIGFYALGDSKTNSWTNLFTKPYPETSKGNTDIVTELALGWYSLDKEGNLLTDSGTGWQRPAGWGDVLKQAKKYQLNTEMVIHLTNRGGIINSILNDKNAVSNAVENIINEARLYEGINLNLEGLGFQVKGDELRAVQASFNQFTKTLAEKAKALDLRLTLTLHPPNSVYKGYDYKTLGGYADKIIIMAYDYGAKPEPISLVTQAVEEALLSVPKEKLVLGISIPSENTESLIPKVNLAKKYRLKGIALWRLGLLTDEMWNVLRSLI